MPVWTLYVAGRREPIIHRSHKASNRICGFCKLLAHKKLWRQLTAGKDIVWELLRLVNNYTRRGCEKMRAPQLPDVLLTRHCAPRNLQNHPISPRLRSRASACLAQTSLIRYFPTARGSSIQHQPTMRCGGCRRANARRRRAHRIAAAIGRSAWNHKRR